MQTITLPEELEISLNAYLKTAHKQRKEVIAEAVERYLVRAAQDEGIREALAEDSYITHEEMDKWIKGLH